MPVAGGGTSASTSRIPITIISILVVPIITGRIVADITAHTTTTPVIIAVATTTLTTVVRTAYVARRSITTTVVRTLVRLASAPIHRLAPVLRPGLVVRPVPVLRLVPVVPLPVALLAVERARSLQSHPIHHVERTVARATVAAATIVAAATVAAAVVENRLPALLPVAVVHLVVVARVVR